MLSLKTKELSSGRDVIRSVCREIRLSFSRTWLIHTKRLRLLNNKGFREESMTKVELDAIGTSTTLESNKSLPENMPQIDLLAPFDQLFRQIALLMEVGVPALTDHLRHLWPIALVRWCGV